MSGAVPVHGRSKNLVPAAMIFAVAMTFIDQTIVSIAVPQIQTKPGLSATGVQWAVNAYLLALASLFAFGGRRADTLGHRKMVTVGVIVFAGASALCGATPKGSLAEAWLIVCRALQGLGGAIMFPAAQLVAQGAPRSVADHLAAGLAQMQNNGSSSGSSGNGAPDLSQIPHFYKVAFAQSTATIFYAMAGIMAVAAIVAFVGLRPGIAPEAVEASDPAPTPGAAEATV